MNNYVVRMADGGIIGGLDRLGTLSGNVKQALSNIVYGGGGQGGQSTDQGIIPFDEEGRARPTYPSFQEYMETDDSGNVGIMASLGKDEDTTGPLQADPDYSGIEAFDIYQGLAPEQFKRRRIQDQKFDKKRGFKFGQMVRLDAMDNKLMKMGGASPRSFSPEVADQMYIVLGRDVG